MKYFKLEREISYVMENNFAIVLDFTTGEFMLLSGLPAKLINIIGIKKELKYMSEVDIKLELYKNEIDEFNDVIDDLIKNNIICEQINE